MDSIFKSFLGVFFLVILSCTGIGLLEASIEARGADSYLSRVVSQVEAGHYSEQVIKAAKSDARARGYELEIELDENDRGECCGIARLTYVYRVPLLGLSQSHVACADIR